MARMFEKLKAAGVLTVQAIARPQMVFFALRERGLAHVLRRFMGSDAASIDAMARDLRFRSMPATPENLKGYYDDVRFEAPEDPEHHMVRLPSGERFLIRRSRGWHDLGTLYDTFVNKIYADHPPVDGKTVLDIGANIGDTAVYFAELGAHVTAYEPDPQMCSLARRNAALNDVDVQFHNAGIGCATETLQLSASVDGADSMSVTLFPGSEPVNRLHVTSRPVRIIAFADALSAFESVDLVKLDCEGCEYPALASLPPHVLRKIDHIVMEFHEHEDALAQTLRSAGFSVRIDRGIYMYADRLPAFEGAASPPQE